LGVLVRAATDNQSRNKHVESWNTHCLDEGSNPSDSTPRVSTPNSVCFSFFISPKPLPVLKTRDTTLFSSRVRTIFFSKYISTGKIEPIIRGINKKIPVLRESLNTHVKSKMGDALSVYEREKQRSEEVYLYLINQAQKPNSKDRLKNLSDKTNNFYQS